MADPTAAADALSVRVAREHLRLARRQIGRIPLPYLLIDVFLCWLLVRLGLQWPAAAWFVALIIVQSWRWRYAAQHAADHAWQGAGEDSAVLGGAAVQHFNCVGDTWVFKAIHWFFPC